MKIILNKCFGGFGLSTEAYKLYAEKIGKEIYEYGTKCALTKHSKIIADKINEILDYLGEIE